MRFASFRWGDVLGFEELAEEEKIAALCFACSAISEQQMIFPPIVGFLVRVKPINAFADFHPLEGPT